MRKALLSGLLASAAVLAVAAPAYALLVSDSFVFSNQTGQVWTMDIPPSVSGSVNPMVVGTNPLNPGSTQYSVVTATDGVPISFQVVWRSTDGTVCTYNGSQSKNAYGNWQTTVTKTRTGGPANNTVQCNFTPPGSGSTKFTLNYGVSN